jgi:hypothetical protein
MAAADTARMIATLELKDQFSKGLKTAERSLGSFEGRLGKIGPLAAQGAKTAVANLAKIGVVAGAGIGLMVKQGLSSLQELESATTSAQAALEQMGLAGQVTGQQIATWANEIEASIGAAFDDKEIIAASTTLIRFGKVTSDNLRPALVVMTDLATKTGSVESAASLLAKALADPDKAAGKLARSGVVLTKAQQDQIKAMTKAGKVAEAQAFILSELEKSTKGAAAASQGPYKRALSVLADVTEDAQRALAEGFLPVLERVAKLLSQKLADPKVIAGIRSFGQSLAGGLDSLISIAERLPWGTIGDSLKIAGAGAKAVLGAFVSLPPWIQTAVLTGWGLNKLTGGALGKIAGELGGSIVGSLGKSFLQRGGTPATPLFTKEVGLGGAGGPSVAGKVGGIGMLGMGALVAEAAVLAAAVYAVHGKIGGDLARQAQGVQGQTASFIGQATPEELRKSLSGLLQQQRDLNGDLVKSIASTIFPQGRDQLADSIAQLQAALEERAGKITEVQKTLPIPPQKLSSQAEAVLKRAVANGLSPDLHDIQMTMERNNARARETAEASRKTAAAVAIAERVRSFQQMFANMQLAAIARKDFKPVMNVTVPVTLNSSVSVRGINVAQSVRASYNRGTRPRGIQIIEP